MDNRSIKRHTPMANNLVQFIIRTFFRIGPYSGATLTKHRHQTPVLSLHQHHYPDSQLKKKQEIFAEYIPEQLTHRFLMRKISISIESKSGRCVRVKRVENPHQRVWRKHQNINIWNIFKFVEHCWEFGLFTKKLSDDLDTFSLRKLSRERERRERGTTSEGCCVKNWVAVVIS